MNVVYLLVLCTTTLPLYSLVVQMGSDFKGSLLPPLVRARLEAAAAAVDPSPQPVQSQEDVRRSVFTCCSAQLLRS